MPHRSRRSSLGPVLVLLASGCPSYVQLERRAGHDPGSSMSWVCPAATGGERGALLGGECAADATVDDARWNQSGTTHFFLPDCPNGIRRIRTGGDTVLVECAAPDRRHDDLQPLPQPATPPPAQP